MKIQKFVTGITLSFISIIISADQSVSDFDKLDKNKDGFISHLEISAVESYTLQWFESDINNDDKLNRTEFNTYNSNNRFVPLEQYAEEC